MKMDPPIGEHYARVDGDRHSQSGHERNAACYAYPKCVPADAVSPRADMLREAEKLITGDRNNQYGPPTQDFKRTADLLNALGYRRVDAIEDVHEIVPSDVALMIAQVKMSRLMHSRGKRDSWVDLAGYAACGLECAVEEQG